MQFRNPLILSISLLYMRTKTTSSTNNQLKAVCCDHGVSHISAHSSQYGGQSCFSHWRLLLPSGGPSLKFVSLAHVCGTLGLMNPPLFSRSWGVWCGQTLCVCEASIVQHRRLLLPPAGWPGGQHCWDKAGLFCSHDVMANKAPWWNWLTLCKPTIALHIDDVTHPHQPRLLQGQQGHEHEGGVIKVEGEVVCVVCPFFHIGGSLQQLLREGSQLSLPRPLERRRCTDARQKMHQHASVTDCETEADRGP